MVVVSNMSCFHPELWGNDPNWRSHIFEMGGLKPPTSLANNPWIKPYFLRGVALWGFRKHDTCRTAPANVAGHHEVAILQARELRGEAYNQPIGKDYKWYTSGTPPKFNSSPVKNDGWKTSFLLGLPIFWGYVKFQGCIYCQFCDYIYHLLPIKGTRNNHWGKTFPDVTGLELTCDFSVSTMGETAPLKKSSGMNMS